MGSSKPTRRLRSGLVLKQLPGNWLARRLLVVPNCFIFPIVRSFSPAKKSVRKTHAKMLDNPGKLS
jgi:hypothetical protein